MVLSSCSAMWSYGSNGLSMTRFNLEDLIKGRKVTVGLRDARRACYVPDFRHVSHLLHAMSPESEREK